MSFLWKIFLVVLLCSCGAWIFAALLGFVWNVQPVDWDSRIVRFLVWLKT
jgi:hypothetical protein